MCEVLWRLGVRPSKPAGKLTKRQIENLIPIIRDVLNDAIASGGSSLRDHRQADGSLGYFQHQFRVYSREGHPCYTPNCTGVVKRIVQTGRSSFYCPKCQK